MNNTGGPGPAIALTTDTSALTALSNDYGYEEVFSRQLQALAAAGDLLNSDQHQRAVRERDSRRTESARTRLQGDRAYWRQRWPTGFAFRSGP